MKKILVLLLLVNQAQVSAQQGGVMNNWHFGWFAAMEFTSGVPVSVSGSGSISIEGCVSYSDLQGNLLFYSNGGSNNGSVFPAPGGVWNKNHQIMPNGAFNNTMGCMSASQSSLVIPKSSTEYYLFTMGCFNDLNLRYCIVDMSLDGGLGDVTDMGTVLQDDPNTNLYEGITATHHANGTDYWLIVHGPGNEFYVYLVNSSGISGPTVQTIGSTSLGSQIKFSLQGDKLLTSNALFDFDNTTGILSNPFSFADNAYGLAFSPSGQYVYRRVITEPTLEQYDLNAVDVLASEFVVATGLAMPGGSLQIGPDLKLYVARMDQPKLAAINDPDMAGAACNFVLDQVDLGGMNCKLGLPNYVDSELLKEHNSIDELEDVQVQVFPNPTMGDIKIKPSNGIVIESVDLLNLSGCRIAQYSYSENLHLDVASGTYILVFNSGNQPVSRVRVVVR